ncbi:hypothetical protein [Cohnella candidum]|uniref:hypothetical protein n=1 Tax=Cohnella candidum TaxID=2674991 RepID=UPI0013DE1501|nr:hypothetical protein [Cohnella candidum]
MLGDPKSNAVKERNLEEKFEGSISSRIETSLARLSSLKNNKSIEIRLHCSPLYCSLYRFDDELFVTPHLYGLRGKSAPLFLFKRTEEGLFYSYEKHFDDIWGTAEVKKWDEIISVVV